VKWQRLRPDKAPFVVTRTGVRKMAAGHVWLGYADSNWRFLVFEDADGWVANYDSIQRREAVGPFGSLEQAQDWCEARWAVRQVAALRGAA